uniref:SUPPRESSOR OF GAMMA RESPONSE 1-like n=1 Tax=Erigeron canadensis TaxID=72917 RepID=UPI001CB99ACE|nr:SUPPRESSOR OF GAMMA RESPONSE 1-like [Erigeron canadensis]
MAKSWLIDGRTIARKVKTSSLPKAYQIKDGGVTRECPNCHYKIDNSDVSVEWPGLPVGVKFEPTDVELMGHLAAKCGEGNTTPHPFINDFIPTIDVDEGICSKHPENLPGARKDGNSVHYFYRTTNAYTTGQRKRRKVCKESTLNMDVRWHKTGKTKAIKQNGVQIGCKKILVLYGSGGGGSKPYKLNWVMHQYHLGTVEDEKDGQYVVAKIFYQSEKEIEKLDNLGESDELDAWMRLTSPKTPNTDARDPPRPGKSVLCDNVTTDCVLQTPAQDSVWQAEQKCIASSSNAQSNDNLELPIWEDDSQTVDLDAFDDALFCNENLDTYAPLGDSNLYHGLQSGSNVNSNGAPGTSRGASAEAAELENLDLGTPPDFNLSDLHFSSQDSIFGWLGRL